MDKLPLLYKQSAHVSVSLCALFHSISSCSHVLSHKGSLQVAFSECLQRNDMFAGPPLAVSEPRGCRVAGETKGLSVV